MPHKHPRQYPTKTPHRLYNELFWPKPPMTRSQRIAIQAADDILRQEHQTIRRQIKAGHTCPACHLLLNKHGRCPVCYGATTREGM